MPPPRPRTPPTNLQCPFENLSREKLNTMCITYQRRQRGMILTAAHKRNTKPLNVCLKVVRYTLLNSIAPINWEMTLKIPYAQNKEPTKTKVII